MARFVMLAGAIGCAVLPAGGCRAPRGPFVISDPDPTNKIPAITRAVDRKDLGAAKQMVAELDSDDPAVRFYAIEGLRRLTGQTLGYQFWDDDAKKRAPAIARWQAWAKDQ